MFNLGIAYGAKVGLKLRLDKGMESASAKCPLGCFGVTPFEENGVSDPTWTAVSLHPFPLSRCSVGCRWIGMNGSIMLGKVLGKVDRSGLNCGRKIQLGFMDKSVLRNP